MGARGFPARPRTLVRPSTCKTANRKTRVARRPIAPQFRWATRRSPRAAFLNHLPSKASRRGRPMRRIDDGLTNQHRYVKRMRAAGRCPNCGKSTDGKGRYCRPCKAHKYQLRRQYRARKRAARPVAFCVLCRKPRGNRPKFCAACGMTASQRRQNLAKRGLCVCHKPLAAGKRRCAKCLAKNAARMKAKSKARIAAGLCQKCGRKAEPGFAHCAQHLEYARVRYWTKRGLPAPPRRPKLTPQKRRRPTRRR